MSKKPTRRERLEAAMKAFGQDLIPEKLKHLKKQFDEHKGKLDTLNLKELKDRYDNQQKEIKTVELIASTPKAKVADAGMADMLKSIAPIFVEEYRRGAAPKGAKRVEELKAKGIKAPDMDRDPSLKERGAEYVVDNLRALINTGKKGGARISSLENKNAFIHLLALLPEKHANDLMTTATLEARLSAKAKHPKSGDLGLFQVKLKFYDRQRAKRANELLKKVGYKKRLTSHSQLTDPVKALAYEITSGKKASMPIVDKYILHQQEEAGKKRQDIASNAPDSAFLTIHAPHKRPEGLPNRQKMQSISDIDDMFGAMIGNVRGAKRNKIVALRKFIRKLFPKNRKEIFASELDKNTFNLVKKAIKLYDLETAEHVAFSEAAPKGKILEKAAAARARILRLKKPVYQELQRR